MNVVTKRQGKVLQLLSAATTSHSHTTTYSLRNTHKPAALFFFSAAFLGIYLRQIYTPFKLTHTLAACDSATVSMMKIKWTTLGLSSQNLHSNSNAFFTVSHSNPPYHTNLPRMPLSYTVVADKHRTLGSAPQQRGDTHARLNGLFAHGSLQSAEFGIFGFVNGCPLHFGKCIVLQ